MKTLCAAALIAVLSLTACQGDSDFARPAYDDSKDIALTEKVTGAPEVRQEDKTITLSGNKCMRVHTTNWLYATGKFTQIRPSIVAVGQSLESTEIRDPSPKGIYTIEGQGAGFSQAHTRCTTHVKLIYNTLTRKLDGRLTTKFIDGIVVEQKIEGEVQAKEELGALVLTAAVSNAFAQSGSTMFNLSDGEMRLVLPTDPKGSFMATLYTKGEFCIPERY
jgi:hypothetical protein